MSLKRSGLFVWLALALVACGAPTATVADPPPSVASATVTPVAEGMPQDPALLAAASGQPVFIEFYTDW